MSLFQRIFLALFVPFIAAIIVLLPLHGALLSANYLAYINTSYATTVLTGKFDPFYQLTTYQKLFQYWLQHKAQMPLLTRTLPLIAIPTGTLLLACFACYRFLRAMKERFTD